ncbi:hypothetical protein HY477_01940 [Candidatus Uhrbacteria bacterium]|nr:hypothetical protein [Candidatus Uhrbacteria bacterium]
MSNPLQLKNLFTPKEWQIFKPLNTPRKIQDFVNRLPINFEKDGETCFSPRQVLKHRRAHCVEGAVFAATALRVHGYPPLILDLTAAPRDEDHVVAIFKQHGAWGAISKTNHAVLRYREPIYKTLRELALSYFHEYFDDVGRKNLRSFSRPVDLSRFDRHSWMTAQEHLWYIPAYLVDVPHTPILSRGQIATLRRADKIELKAGDHLEWSPKLY